MKLAPPRLLEIGAAAVALYLAADLAYIVKSAAGVDVIHGNVPLVGGHHGPWFWLSDDAVHHSPNGTEFHPLPVAVLATILIGSVVAYRGLHRAASKMP